MRPTALGLKALGLYAMIQVAFFVSPYTNLFFLLLAFLGTMLVLSIWWTMASLRGVAGHINEIEPGAAGSDLLVQVHLESRQRPRFRIGAELRVGRRREPLGSVPVVHGEAVLSATLKPRARGIYPIEAAFLNSTWPLGFLSRRRAFDAPAELIVYPALLPQRTGPRGGNAIEEMFGGISIAGADNSGPGGLREYRVGDPLRLVHWKATARRRELVIKELDGEAQRGLEVVLDRRTDPERLETCLSVLSTLAVRARDEKEPIVLKSQGISHTFGVGHEPLGELMRWLAAAEALPADGPAPPSAAPTALRLPAAFANEAAS